MEGPYPCSPLCISWLSFPTSSIMQTHDYDEALGSSGSGQNAYTIPANIKSEENSGEIMLSDPFERTHHVTRTYESDQESTANMVLGEFSFAPTTETTVYTTKVVKTINFPPLVMKGPKHLHELDPKLYPLAASPTPPALKKFCFDIDGKPTVFREAEDPDATLSEVRVRFCWI